MHSRSQASGDPRRATTVPTEPIPDAGPATCVAERTRTVVTRTVGSNTGYANADAVTGAQPAT